MDKDHFESKIYFRDPMTTNLNSFRGARRSLLPRRRHCHRQQCCPSTGTQLGETRAHDTAAAYATRCREMFASRTRHHPGLPCPCRVPVHLPVPALLSRTNLRAARGAAGGRAGDPGQVVVDHELLVRSRAASCLYMLQGLLGDCACSRAQLITQ